jgi:murein DD-endopeptidase MepM/ murein hydrolase activator NlpD
MAVVWRAVRYLLLVLLMASPALAALPEPGPELVFPLPGATRAGSQFAEGRFGAYRPGRRGHRECGRGHCGVDLCAPAGSMVVAVRDGVVEQIARSGGGEGGRWIRVRHDDGTASWYMHLGGLRPGLKPGVAVEAGDPLATLGRTGVSTSPTHLHFAVTKGKGPRERHIDPTSLLERAVLTPRANAAPTS